MFFSSCTHNIGFKWESVNTWLCMYMYYTVTRYSNIRSASNWFLLLHNPSRQRIYCVWYRVAEEGRKHITEQLLTFFLPSGSAWPLVRKVNQGDAAARKNAAIQNFWLSYAYVSSFVIKTRRLTDLFSFFKLTSYWKN